MRTLPLALLTLLAAGSALAQTLVIGQSVPLSGPNADVGAAMRDGAQAVFARANAAHVLSRRIQLVTLDNADDRQRSAAVTQQLLDQHGAMVLFGYSSAASSLDALPLAARHQVLFFAPFSGSGPLREHPNVFTIRASYKTEAAKILATKRTAGADKAVVLHYDDVEGGSHYEAVAAAYREAGMTPPKAIAVKRGAPVELSTVAAAAREMPHYVLATTQFGTVGDFLRVATSSGHHLSMAALSFVNPGELAESAGEVARGTVISQVMPSPSLGNQMALPVVRDCAEALAALNGSKLNLTSLEACIAAKALLAVLKKAGPSATREGVLQAAGSVGRLDLGGYSLDFSPSNRHGSHWVDLTILSSGNRFVH
jgi:branched-chain amino acid transport system substrate-binding protein